MSESKFPQQTITVQPDVRCNRVLMFEFMKRKLRGTWSTGKLPGKSSAKGIMNMPEIPGLHLTVDFRGRRLVITDPLGDEDNKDLLKSIQDTKTRSLGGYVPQPETTIVRENLTDSDMKSILLEISNWVRHKKAKVVAGKVPTVEEVLDIDCPHRINTFDSGQHAKRVAHSKAGAS